MPRGAPNAAKTQCPHGHPYDAENTRYTASGFRWCFRCDSDRRKAKLRANGRIVVARADRTHCPQGHAYDAQNTRIGRVPSGASRICIRCDLDRGKAKRRAGGRVVTPHAARTQCPKGHPYDETNTRICNGMRFCRACDLAAHIARDNENPARMIWASAKTRARQRGIPFSIEVTDVVIPEMCPVLGITIRRRIGRGPGSKDHSPSLDRTIPALGYVPGNVVVISFRANRIKSDASIDEIDRIASWLRATLPNQQKDTGT